MTRHEAVDVLVKLANEKRVSHESTEGQALMMSMKALLAWDKVYGGLEGERDKYKKDGYFFSSTSLRASFTRN